MNLDRMEARIIQKERTDSLGLGMDSDKIDLEADVASNGIILPS